MQQPDSPRLYTEKEVRSLIRRGTELQEMTRQTSAVSSGISLAEIETIASELGIDPGHIRSAAAELEQSGTADFFSVLRLPRSTTLERTVPRALGPEDWPALVGEIRRTFGSTGQTGQLGTSLEWSGRLDFRA